MQENLKEILKTTDSKLRVLASKGIKSVLDLINYLPRTHEIRFFGSSVGELDLRNKITFPMEITSIEKKTTFKQRKKILIISGKTNANERVELTYFGNVYIADKYRTGDKVIVSGKAKYEYGAFKLSNPDIDFYDASSEGNEIVPIYVETEGMSSSWLRSKMRLVFDRGIHLEEFLPEEVIKEEDLLNINEALKEYHLPSSKEALDRAKKRLAFSELLLLQLSFLARRLKYQSKGGKVVGKEEDIAPFVKEYLEILNFELTDDQKVSLYEVLKDLCTETPMLRLLQGDVGSGKTAVAEIACYFAIKNGFQAVFLVPTEALARQHAQNIGMRMLKKNIKTELLIGSIPLKKKKEIKEDLRLGRINLVVGTHALIQDDLSFKNLGIAIIDEQHRFGVEQRKILVDHGAPHILHMTATPIPRTLALAFAGDQDVSIIRQKPAGRKDIITKVVYESKRNQMYQFMASELEKGRRAYVICPLIESSDKEGMDDVKAVTEEFEILKSIFDAKKIGLLHGKMSSEDKKLVLEAFGKGNYNILVSTTVIEVGIDVPEATIIVIEGAERFGLSQLHQLRGRVGRSDTQSYCFLATSNPDKGMTKRLQIMEKTNDGFKIAKEDLEIRGPGEVYGLRQSGIPDLQVASYYDYNLLKKARDWGKWLLADDPKLSKYPKLKAKIHEKEIIRA